jgi:parallel beta-helix repeat protein
MKLISLFCVVMLALFVVTIGRVVFPSVNGTKISLSPTHLKVLPGDCFTVDVSVAEVDRLSGWQVVVKYNGSIINCTSVWIPDNNVFAGKACVSLPAVLNEHTVDGYAYTIFGNSLFTESVNVSSGSLCNLNFSVQTYGSTQLQIATKENPAQYANITSWRPKPFLYSMLIDTDLQELPYTIEDGSVEVGNQQTLTVMTSEGGTTSPSPGTHLNSYGQRIVVTAIPDSGYALSQWLLDGDYAGKNSSIEVLMTENHTLQPVFIEISFTLTISWPAQAAVDPAPGTHQYPAGEVIQVSASVNPPYRFDHWVLDESYTVFDNPISVLMQENHTLAAVVSEASYTRTIYIRPDGIVEPFDVPIQTIDNVTFSLTGNIVDSIIVVQKSNTIIDGNGYVLQGSGSGEGLSLYGVSNVTIKNLNIRGFDRGICLLGASLSVISANNITSNKWLGIALYSSSNNTISQNTLKGNGDVGIRIEYGSNWNTIVQNSVDGNKWLGIYIDSSSNNSIHHNNWENNTTQAYVAGGSYFSTNFWDDGVEGNYWSGHVGVDSNHDGAIDVPFILNEENVDHFPLLGEFHCFGASTDYSVDIVSNSTIEEFQYSQVTRKITFNVKGVDDTVGCCKIAVEHTLMDINHLQVLIDGGQTPLICVNYDLHDNTTHRWIYFAYEQSTHTVEIVEDLVPPAIALLSPESKTYSVRNLSLAFTVNESVSWSGYSLDDAQNVTVDTNMTLTNLVDGAHEIVIFANDSVGNMGSSPILLFAVDTTPPNIAAVCQGPDTDLVSVEDSVKVNATVTDDTSGVGKVSLIYSYTNGSAARNGIIGLTNIEANHWTGVIPAFPYGTSVRYTVIAEDNAGNIAATSVEFQYEVIPEFPLSPCLMLFMTISFVGAGFVRRKRAGRVNTKVGRERFELSTFRCVQKLQETLSVPFPLLLYQPNAPAKLSYRPVLMPTSIDG